MIPAVRSGPIPVGHALAHQLAVANTTTQSSETYGSHLGQRGSAQLTHGSIGSPHSQFRGNTFDRFMRESLTCPHLGEAALA